MNFNELYNLVVEAKGTKPGERFYKSQKNIGPMGVAGQNVGITSYGGSAGEETSSGYSSSPVGKVDSFEKSQKIEQMKKYLYDTSKGGSQNDTYELEAENKKRMRNAFALLFNSKDFFSSFKKIYNDYMGSGNFARNSITLEDEKEWNRLKDDVDRKTTNNTATRNRLDELKKYLREAENASNKINEIEDYIKRLKNEKSKTKNTNIRNSIDEQIKSAQFDINTLQNSAKQNSINEYRKEIKKLERNLVSDTEQEMLTRDKFTELQDKISSVTEKNMKISDNVIMLVKKLINQKADGLLDRYKIEHDISDEEIDSKNVDFANVPKDLVSKLKLLKELTTEDNPIFAFIDYHKKEFDERMGEFDSRLLNSNINIGSMRMFDKLPAKILGKYFTSIAGNSLERKVIPLENLDVDTGYLTIDSFIKKLEQINTKEQWETAKPELKKLVKNLPLKKTSKDIILSRLKGFWSVSRTGANSAKQLLTTLNQMRKEEMVNESFDELAAKYASSFIYDENDFLIDLLEVKTFLESSKKCTGPTKKASSDRKGKKWTKCARQPDGSYKRIHWGQAGVRVTGKSGNTKRKKSFRKRHNCSKAKPGTPNAESCKDW